MLEMIAMQKRQKFCLPNPNANHYIELVRKKGLLAFVVQFRISNLYAYQKLFHIHEFHIFSKVFSTFKWHEYKSIRIDLIILMVQDVW